MSLQLTTRCPAKVNLFLSVGEPDENGYHPIRTIFQAIGLCDRLTVTLSESDQFVCSWDRMPERNTITKALGFLREAVALPPLSIKLQKVIPPESGLGGGSSDAAALIRCVAFLMPDAIPPGLQHDIALAVGADVPFFLVGGLARGEGYGEKITPLPDPEESWVVIVRPDVGVSTAAAYRALDAKPREWRDFSQANEPYNDFERVAPCESLEWIDRLKVHGAKTAMLSGSGSAVFGTFPDKDRALDAASKLKAECAITTFTARTLTREESLRVESTG